MLLYMVKNKTNEEEQNEDCKIPKHVFYKAFEIYIHAQIVKVLWKSSMSRGAIKG